ncbi:comm2 [Cochliomyia hominivorax]
MENLRHSLNNELPQELHFDKYAQHILENSRTPNLADTTTIALSSSPSITTFDVTSTASSAVSLESFSQLPTTSDFFKKIGTDFINYIQLQSLPKSNSYETTFSTSVASTGNMEMEFGPHHLIMDPKLSNNALEDFQNQQTYDKFMNGIWIGVVMALILISMIFCFCSCFLYHQFRVWKRNYRTTVTQSTDVEAVKLNLDSEDPVPEYTLVSGLPSYEAALELLHKSPQSCLIVHPSVFEVFNKNEKSTTESPAENSTNSETSQPLLSESSENQKSSLPSYNEATTTPTTPTTPSTPSLPYNHSLASLLSLASNQKSQLKNKTTASSPTTSEAEKQFKS